MISPRCHVWVGPHIAVFCEEVWDQRHGSPKGRTDGGGRARRLRCRRLRCVALPFLFRVSTRCGQRRGVPRASGVVDAVSRFVDAATDSPAERRRAAADRASSGVPVRRWVCARDRGGPQPGHVLPVCLRGSSRHRSTADGGRVPSGDPSAVDRAPRVHRERVLEERDGFLRPHPRRRTQGRGPARPARRHQLQRRGPDAGGVSREVGREPLARRVSPPPRPEKCARHVG